MLYTAVLDMLPGWQNLGLDIRSKLLSAAKIFIRDGSPEVEIWWRTLDQFSWSGYSGVKMLVHILRHDPSFIEGLPLEVWRAWAPAILTYQFSGPEELQAGNRIYALCYRAIPAAFIALLKERLEILLSAGAGHVVWDALLKGQWDNALADIVASGARDARLEQSSLQKAMALLLEKDPAVAERLLAEALEERARTDDREVAHAATVIAAALAHDGGQRWAVIWRKIRDDACFAGAVIQGMLDNIDDAFRVAYHLTALNESDLADLHTFLAQQYPGEADERDGCVGPITRSYWTRNSVIRYLVEKGTEAAIAALERITREAPGYEDMLFPLIDARENLRRRSWRPLLPTELKGLLDRADDRRLVRSGDELLDALVESLKGLNEKLQGETPRARLLWNMARGRQGDGRPKDENDLSDYVKGQLEDDLKGRLIGVQREVEIRRARKGAKGQRTDIHVTAHIPRSHEEDVFDPITVIVEVKGCWNDELQAAMKSQLVDRYMTSSGCCYGIYLVGWFECGAWMQDNQRRSRTPRWAYEDAVEFFKQQAADLSSASARVRSVVLDCRIR